MHNVVLMAVIDARKHLFHQDCCIFFTKLAARENFVEQFTSFADPMEVNNNKKSLLCYKVVALRVFKELVHLHDVGVILRRTGRVKI